MGRLLKETKVTERFAGPDIRAKVASGAEALEAARHILGNAPSRSPENITGGGRMPCADIAQHRFL